MIETAMFEAVISSEGQIHSPSAQAPSRAERGDDNLCGLCDLCGKAVEAVVCSAGPTGPAVRRLQRGFLNGPRNQGLIL